MKKQTKFHHSVTENGNLQARILTECFADTGMFLSRNYSKPKAPADTRNMDGWDDISKDIVEAITDPKVISDFAAEKLSVIIGGKEYKHPSQKTGVGPEECVSYDRELNPVNCSHGEISVREIHRAFDDGVEIGKWYRRSWIFPDQNPDGKDVMSRALAVKLHTPEVIDAWKAKMAA